MNPDLENSRFHSFREEPAASHDRHRESSWAPVASHDICHPFTTCDRERISHWNKIHKATFSPQFQRRKSQKAFADRPDSGDTKIMLGTVLLVILILLLLGALPNWGYSRSWGYGPSGGLGLVVVIIIILLLMGRI
jgi:hypothetical protein